MENKLPGGWAGEPNAVAILLAYGNARGIDTPVLLLFVPPCTIATGLAFSGTEVDARRRLLGPPRWASQTKLILFSCSIRWGVNLDERPL